MSRSLGAALRGLPMLSPAETAALARARDAGDETAVTRMVEGHLRFAVWAAARYRGYGSLSLDDRISVAAIGLHEAARRFDPGKGAKFTTYAVTWIRGGLQIAYEGERLVRLPSYGLREANREGRFRYPADEFVSLDTPAPGRRWPRIDDLPASEPDQDERLRTKQVADVVHEALAGLPPKLAAVLRLRFGIVEDGGEALTLKQIGDRLGVSRERVRQIEAQAFWLVRQALRSGRKAA